LTLFHTVEDYPQLAAVKLNSYGLLCLTAVSLFEHTGAFKKLALALPAQPETKEK